LLVVGVRVVVVVVVEGEENIFQTNLMTAPSQ